MSLVKKAPGLRPVARPHWVPPPDDGTRPSWEEHAGVLGRMFAGNVAERANLARQRKELDGLIKALDEKIKAPLSALGESVRSVAVGDIKVTLVSQTRSSIVKEMMAVEMMKLGIEADEAYEAIQRATKTSQSEFVKVTSPKEDDDAE